jgi:hypothetical protein
MGKKNFPSITQREFLLNFFGGTNGYESSVKQWLQELDFESFQEMLLE